MIIQRKANYYQKNKEEAEERAKRKKINVIEMHIAKLKEKKDKFKHGLGQLQEGL